MNWSNILTGASTVLGPVGGVLSNAANAHQAEANRRFQERMSNTSYQRAVADMRKAGLNPALAYQQGGASSPSGSQANMQNAAQGLGNAANEVATSAAQRRQIEAQTELTSAEAQQIKIESAARLAELTSRTNLQTSTAGHQAFQNALLGHQSEGTALGNQFLRQTFDTRVRQLTADYEGSVANARNLNASALLSELRSPREANRAAAEKAIGDMLLTPFISGARQLFDHVKGFRPSDLKLNNPLKRNQ